MNENPSATEVIKKSIHKLRNMVKHPFILDADMEVLLADNGIILMTVVIEEAKSILDALSEDKAEGLREALRKAGFLDK